MLVCLLLPPCNHGLRMCEPMQELCLLQSHMADRACETAQGMPMDTRRIAKVGWRRVFRRCVLERIRQSFRCLAAVEEPGRMAPRIEKAVP